MPHIRMFFNPVSIDIQEDIRQCKERRKHEPMENTVPGSGNWDFVETTQRCKLWSKWQNPNTYSWCRYPQSSLALWGMLPILESVNRHMIPTSKSLPLSTVFTVPQLNCTYKLKVSHMHKRETHNGYAFCCTSHNKLFRNTLNISFSPSLCLFLLDF